VAVVNADVEAGPTVDRCVCVPTGWQEAGHCAVPARCACATACCR
jgi:hypothetical protein